MSWWWRWWRREELDRQLDAELRDHIERLTADYMAAGMEERESRRRAWLEFGGLEQIKEMTRDMRGLRAFDDLVRDIRYTTRCLVRTPGFTVVAVATLAIGIGGNAAVFSVISTLVLRPLPFPDPGQLVRIIEQAPGAETPNGRAVRGAWLTDDDVEALKAAASQLSHVAQYTSRTVALTTLADVAVLEASEVGPALLPMLGVRPALGRLLLDGDTHAGAESVVLLGHRAWVRHFGRDPMVIGTRANIDGRDHIVIGVLPEGFSFPTAATDLWLPLGPPAGPFETRRFPGLARVREGVSLDAARADVTRALSSSRGFDPASPDRIDLVRLADERAAPVRPAMRVLVVAVAFVLLIACTNVASLMLARTIGRGREVTIRAALGAGRRRLVQQVLVESSLLGVIGGAAGCALGLAATRFLTAWWPSNVNPRVNAPRLEPIDLDLTVLLFTALVSIVTGVLCGLLAAWHVARMDHTHVVRDAPATSATGGRVFGASRIRGVLVTIEIGVAMILLSAAGLLVHSFLKLVNVEKGFEMERVFTFRVAAPAVPLAERTRVNESITSRLSELPGIESAGYTWTLPTAGIAIQPLSPTNPFQAPGTPAARQEPLPMFTPVSRDYLPAIGVTAVAGRMLADADDAGRPPVVLINEALARTFYAGENPIGKRVRVVVGEAEIVGIVADLRQRRLDVDPEPQFFVDTRQLPAALADTPVGRVLANVSFAIKTQPGAPDVETAIRNVVANETRGGAVVDVAGLDRLVANSLAAPRFYAAALGALASAAILLAVIGIYGLITYTIEQRRREVGIRIALGASRSAVLGLVLWQCVVLAVIGIAGGLIAAAGLTRYLQGMLFGLTPLDPATFVVATILFVVVAAAASFMPAYRATTVDPLVALRAD